VCVCVCVCVCVSVCVCVCVLFKKGDDHLYKAVPSAMCNQDNNLNHE